VAKGQEKMAHMKAKRAAEAAAVKVETGHGHTCPACSKTFQHEDPKCTDIGLAYHLCTVCKPDVVKQLDAIDARWGRARHEDNV
jgi:hypothetical protein